MTISKTYFRHLFQYNENRWGIDFKKLYYSILKYMIIQEALISEKKSILT
ncbi:hypothetical protein [Leptospira noguchii]|nr:hypothetical protein [Leptospira noguchii]